MTEEQYEAAKAIAEKDCEIAGKYLCDGQTCILGALAKDAGVDDQTLIQAGSAGIGVVKTIPSIIWASEHPHVVKIAKAVESKFGLSVEDQAQLQAVNDNVRMPYQAWKRRENVIDKLSQLKKGPTVCN